MILDTNHCQELAARTPMGMILESRLDAQGCDGFTTIIAIQEVTQGWLAEINWRKPGRLSQLAQDPFLTIENRVAASARKRHSLMP